MQFYFHPADLEMSSLIPLLILLFVVVIFPALIICFAVTLPKENKKRTLSDKEEENSSALQD